MNKFKIISYNIHKGFNSLGTDFTLDTTKQIIQETNADFILLQEVVGENSRHQSSIDNWPTEPQFEFLADTIWPHFSYGKNAIYKDRHHGNAILSKYPIINSKNINLTINRYEMRGLLHCAIEGIAEEINVAENKSSLVNNKKTLHLLNTHLDLLHGNRILQQKQIIDYIANHISPHDPLILAGDFNDWSKKLSIQFRNQLQLEEAFQVLKGQYACTFPSFLPLLHLDRIYYRHIRPLKAVRLDSQPWSSLSDHLPILMEFEL